MSCRFCTYLGQFAVNFLNLIDHTLNFILLGDPDETVSCRTGRARAAGWKWATWSCKALTFCTKVVTFGTITRDHCDYALDKMIRPNSAEIFSLTNMKFNDTPISEVQVIDNGSPE